MGLYGNPLGLYETEEQIVARGKYLSLEEARRSRKIDRFCKEHPSEADPERFERLLDAVCRGKPSKQPKPVNRKKKP